MQKRLPLTGSIFMTSGKGIKSCLFSLLLFIYIPGYALAGEFENLEGLMKGMASVRQSMVQYREEKQMALLDEPLLSEGTLEYQAPDILIRTVDKPAARYVIDTDRVIIEKSGKTQIRNINQLPLLKGFFESFRAILAGDQDSLQNFYNVTFSNTGEQWRIHLLPKDKKLARYVKSIDVSGRGNSILLYRVEDSNGDLTSMQLFPTVPETVE